MSVVVVECRAYLACYRTVNMILVSQLKPSLEVPSPPFIILGSLVACLASLNFRIYQNFI